MSDLVKRLEQVFVIVQVRRLVEAFEEVARVGYGEVVVEFHNGKPRFIRVQRSEDLSPVGLLKNAERAAEYSRRT